MSVSSPTSKLDFNDLNVRQVFETHTVDQTREIHKKITHEIERKREELRMLVGERYRDLIDAADTIVNMRTTSATVHKDLTNFREKLTTFPIVLAAPSRHETNRLSSLNGSQLEMSAEIKIALETPRRVRSLLDKAELIPVVHLALLYCEKLCPKLASVKLPFLPQDMTLSGSKMMSEILRVCDEILQNFESPTQRLAEAIVVEQVLTHKYVEDVLQRFLATRIDLSKNSLLNKESNFNYTVACTVRSFYEVCIDPQSHNGATKEMRKPKLSEVDFGLSFRPQLIESFNADTVPVDEPPRVARLAEIFLKGYVEPLKAILKESWKSGCFLYQPMKFKDMDQYRKETIDVLKKDCDDLMRLVLGTSKTLWGEVFYPVFQEKCRIVASDSIQTLITFVKDDAFSRYSQADQQFDLINFVWKSSPPTSEVEDDLKLKYISPQIQEFCKEIEEKVIEIQSDFQCLGDASLKEFMSAKMLETLETFLNSLDKNLFLARFSSALLELTPTLWKLLDKNDAGKLRQHLITLSEQSWTLWGETALCKFGNDLTAKMGRIDAEGVLSNIPVAEEFKTDSAEAVKPSVRVPLQISHPLNSLLFAISMELAKVGPQSIPKSVRENIRWELGNKVALHYEELCNHDKDTEEKLSSQAALQLSFDLKFVQWFHPKLGGLMDPLLTKLKAYVDPFDLDIINPEMKGNLKRFLFETHLTLGLMCSEESQTFIAQNFKTKKNQSYPVSNPCGNISFPLLPI